MRAAIYARVSSAAQRDNHTIENQLRVLPSYVAAQGWELVGTYVDDGRSAKAGKLDARDGFAALLRDAELGRFDLLVVVDVDRLTRTNMIEERAQILGPFQRLGIDIVTPSGGRLDMRTMLGELWVTIQAMGAAEENRKRAERIKAGKARAIAEGRKPAGPTPYGLHYSRAEGKWSIDEPRAELVREIFRRVAAGESCVSVADDLARRSKYPPRTGWSRAAVYRIVRKRTAVGEWFADKAKGALIRVPAILTEQEWHDAQRALLRHRRRGLVRTKHVYLLEGIASCLACGEPMRIRSATTNPNGYRNPAAYVCRGRKRGACNAQILRCAELDERVWARLSDELEQPEILTALAVGIRQRAGDAHDWKADIEQHRAHLGRLEVVERKVMERFRHGAISEGALDHELAALGRERKFVRDNLATAERAVDSIENSRARHEAASVLVAALRAKLPTATPEQRRALLRELARDGGVVIANGRARLDLRIGPVAAEAAPTGAARSAAGGAAASLGAVEAVARLSIVHADPADYRTQHGTIAGVSLRLRLVA